MKRGTFRTVGRVLAGMICAAGFSLASLGCAEQKSACPQCNQAHASQCGKDCAGKCTKPCDPQAEGKTCPPGCTKPCCQKA